MTWTWRDEAKKVLNAVVDAKPREANETDADYQNRIKRKIDESYPFGIRKHRPYKVWLEERAAIFFELGIIRKPPKKRFSKRDAPKLDPTSPGQLSLLDLAPPIPAGHGKDPNVIQLPIRQPF